MFFSFPTKECCNHIKEYGVQNLPSLTTNKTEQNEKKLLTTIDEMKILVFLYPLKYIAYLNKIKCNASYLVVLKLVVPV